MPQPISLKEQIRPVLGPLSSRGGALLPVAHHLLRRQFPQALWAGDPQRREIALTFDDGPHPVDTPALLSILERYGVVATFFQIGERAQQWPELTRSIAEAGHQVALHSSKHQPFPLLTQQGLYWELEQARRMVAESAGFEGKGTRYIRPPYGLFLPGTLRLMLRWDYRPVMWSSVPIHWEQSAVVTVQQIVNEVGNGAIIVLHEGLAGDAVGELAGQVIPALLAADYQFITIDDMWHKRFDPPAAT